MKTAFRFRASALALTFVFALASTGAGALAQSRRTPPTQPQKKNQRPGQQTGTTTADDGQKEELPPDLVRQKPTEDEIVRVTANLVNVDAVVYHKKTRQLVGNLTKASFALFEDGVQQEITNFSTPEAKLNVAVVIEFSKLTEGLGLAQTNGWDYGTREVIAPAALFMQEAVQKGDFLSVVAFDMRPTPLTDFTNDPSRVNQAINILLRNRPAFRETNLFDALKFTLVGGVGDPVVLEGGREKADYAGLVAVQGRRRAVLLIASGIDTFSKINYDNARKIAQNAGIPIYVIGTGNMYYKRYESQMSAVDGLAGQPGRMTFQQAANALNTFAKETGGAYFPVTFEGEAPSAVQSINALMRHQYSLGYNPGERRDGKKHKIEVRVDVNGDGQWDDKEYEINHRQFYVAPKPDGKG
ncbi:MAG TPA: VWA domain-containing protein [Pyrinomonadaceae bacterium]